MQTCPYCAEDIQDAAVKCRYCGSRLESGRLGMEWRRKRRGRMIAGVCAGLADTFNVSVTAVRLAAVVLTFLGFGWGVVLYVVLWVIMPWESDALPAPDSTDAGNTVASDATNDRSSTPVGDDGA